MTTTFLGGLNGHKSDILYVGYVIDGALLIVV